MIFSWQGSGVKSLGGEKWAVNCGSAKAGMGYRDGFKTRIGGAECGSSLQNVCV